MCVCVCVSGSGLCVVYAVVYWFVCGSMYYTHTVYHKWFGCVNVMFGGLPIVLSLFHAVYATATLQ